MQPFGQQLVAYRLARANWDEIALAAHPRARVNSARLRGRMLDRLLRQCPPLAGGRGGQPRSGAADFLVESAVLGLRRACVGLPAPRRRTVERVLAGVARHYRQCPRAGHACTPSPALAAQIGAAFVALSAMAESVPRAALASLVSIRLELYPQQATIHGGRHARH